ncbi:MAG: GNAT family N-acetyltransferase [Deltaproteobacteria bacterium]|nr:GNAT family N-acetyltransferase [Deltaproteobacteria bacterium]
MKNILIRDSNELDYQTIVDINDVEVQHTSPMDVKHLRDLDQFSAYHRVAVVEGNVAAFLLAIGENCSYQNENYEWFSSRYTKFLYIDRIVVDAKYGGLKIGTMLYRDIFHYARSNSIPIITCEYNLVPPNEPSRVFHEKFGFKEVGMQWTSNSTKRVSLQAAEV